MRAYSRISPQFWIGKTGKKLRNFGPESQLVALYLLTNPHANMLGVYHLPIAYVNHDLGRPTEWTLKGLWGCVEAGFCNYDLETETVWVYEMAKFQIGNFLKQADNRVTGIQKEYDDLHDNPFLLEYFEKYGKAYCLTNPRKPVSRLMPLTSPSEGAFKGLRSPCEEGPDPVVGVLSCPPSENFPLSEKTISKSTATVQAGAGPFEAPSKGLQSPLEGENAPSKNAYECQKENLEGKKNENPLEVAPGLTEKSPSEAPSKGLRSQEQEQEQEQEQDLKTLASNDFSASEKSSKPGSGDSPPEDISSGPSHRPAISPPHQRIQMDRTTLRWKGILSEDLDRWKDAYPAVDVEQQLREMEVWASAHRSQWKSNWLRFIVHWLSKEQDRGGSSRTGSAPRETPKTFEQIRAERTHAAATRVLDEIYGPKGTEVPDGTIPV